MGSKLKAPFPWFGGKSRVAGLVWDRLGDVDNYIEPFAGSAANLLLRPHPGRIETLNDVDCYVANFWRATGQDPEGVVAHCNDPVNECDLHARHRWLVLSGSALAFRQKMRTDPDYYSCRFAGWWCWGICQWIGSGWCVEPEAPGEHGEEQAKRPRVPRDGSSALPGVHGRAHQGPAGGSGERSPILGGGEGQYGHGAHAKGPSAKMPRIHGDNPGSSGKGVHAGGPATWKARPAINKADGNGMDAISDTHRPQLADAFSRGRGVHGHDEAGTCAERRAWLLDWFGRLRDRLRTVRVCCGDWLRVCNSDSVLTRLGVTGVFLDPPYGEAAGRASNLYSSDSLTVAGDVRRWCLEHGPNPEMRIALAGYAGEGHEELEEQGWRVEAWKASGGYGNRSAVGKANAERERLWFSPHCKNQRGLFD